MNRLVAVLAAFLVALPSSFAAPKTPKKASTPARKAAPAQVESPGIGRPFAVPEKDDASVFPFIKAPAVILCDAVTGRVIY